MATIDLATDLNTGLHPTRGGNTELPYLIESTVDFATALTSKGSALAAADVIQALDVPAESVVLTAGFEVVTALGGTATAATLDLGSGVDADAFADGFDYFAASVGDYSAKATAGSELIVGNTADTIDVTIATLSGGTLISGSLRVWAVLIDVKDRVRPGLAALGS